MNQTIAIPKKKEEAAKAQGLTSPEDLKEEPQLCQRNLEPAPMPHPKPHLKLQATPLNWSKEEAEEEPEEKLPTTWKWKFPLPVSFV